MAETEKAGGLADEFGLAVYGGRQGEDLLTVVLEGELAPDPERGLTGSPPLVARFRRPSPVDLAQIEAQARTQTLDLLKGQGARLRYNLSGDPLQDEAVVSALAPLIAAIEGAVHLITDWNFAEIGPDGPVKAPITVETVARLFAGRPAVRAAWSVHLDNASPLDRVEGNVSAASPNTNMDEAANTAEAAPSETPPAAGASEAAPGSSARA